VKAFRLDLTKIGPFEFCSGTGRTPRLLTIGRRFAAQTDTPMIRAFDDRWRCCREKESKMIAKSWIMNLGERSP
jgi:hypothetical protein